MRLVVRAARLALFLLERPRRVTFVSVGVAVVAATAGVIGVRSLGSFGGARDREAEAADAPAFCKKLDLEDLYLWGEVGEGSSAVRAFASVKDPTSYCTLTSRTTFLPRLRSVDRRLAYVADAAKSGERGQLYVPGGAPHGLPTPNCTTRFRWLHFEDRHPYYGCEAWDPYDKKWYPIFYHGDGAVIGYGRGLTNAIGEPSNGTIIGDVNEGLSIVDTRDATSVIKISGIDGVPVLARAAPKGFIAVTDTTNETRLWRIDRAGKATLTGKYAPLASGARSRLLALASDGELYEYVEDVREGERTTNQVVARTLKRTRVIYSDASLKERGRPYVRLDAKTNWGTGVFTAR